GLTGLLKGLCEEILRIAIVDCRIQPVVKTMSQLDVLRILRLQIRVPRLIGILVEEEKERVQILVSRSVDPASIAQREGVLVVEVIAEKGRREQVHIAAGKGGILVDQRNAIA